MGWDADRVLLFVLDVGSNRRYYGSMTNPTNRKMKNMKLPTNWTRESPGRYRGPRDIHVCQVLPEVWVISHKGKKVGAVESIDAAFLIVDFALHDAK